ncbi:DoxX family protein [Amycolatopsis sp. K13G38]|uniref:DoxX family protein n=1 Tax=Amycolatopsis acididurans TaxID=2724524 RepID=A0ABX1JCR1_9PSEU|nr:DoxX family protein [Amycolatopsis acididurans]NKQ56062.1 DoxX family protein [Amycolatopsis acididurans]
MSTTVSAETTATTTAYRTPQVDLALLLVRIVPFGVLAVFGAQKLFGAFGGGGLTATEASFAQMGYHPPLFFALLGGGCEFAGGLLLLFGALTPLAAAMVMGVMINAFAAVADKPLETAALPVILLVIAAALAFSGPGRFSLDAGRPWQRTGFTWGGVSVALAVVTAGASLVVAH